MVNRYTKEASIAMDICCEESDTTEYYLDIITYPRQGVLLVHTSIPVELYGSIWQDVYGFDRDINVINPVYFKCISIYGYCLSVIPVLI